MAACVHVFVWVCECLFVCRSCYVFFCIYFFKKDVVKTFAAFVGSYGSPV